MFLSKVKDQELELLRASFRNAYLKEKRENLESECKMLTDLIIESQLTRAEDHESTLKLKKELHDLRQIHEKKLQELKIASDELKAKSAEFENTHSSILLTTSEDERVDDLLQAKNDMIECLQKELVNVRLNQAEKWAVIRDLKKTERELENDKEMLNKAKPETISRLQEELMAAKLRETHINEEFAHIKNELSKMKSEVQEHVEVTLKNQQHGPETEANVKLSPFGVLWESFSKGKSKESLPEYDIELYQEELAYLKNKIPILQNSLEILNNQMMAKEEERRKLQDQLNTAKIKEKSVGSITLERNRQCTNLENSTSGKLAEILANTQEKDVTIQLLARKYHALLEQDQPSVSENEESHEVTQLEAQEELLRTRIRELELENAKLSETFNQ